MRKCKRTRIRLVRSVTEDLALDKSHERHLRACDSCRDYQKHLQHCWDMTAMNANQRPRKEVTENIRRSVRVLAAQEKVREQKRSLWRPLRRLSAPLGYAAAGSVLTLCIMLTVVDTTSRTSRDSVQITHSGSMRAESPSTLTEDRPALNRERHDRPYLIRLTTMADQESAGRNSGDAYATGMESQDAQMVSYIY